MGGYAFSALAAEVSKAGGLGFVSTIADMGQADRELSNARDLLHAIDAPANVLPVGIGFLLFIAPLDEAAAVIRKHRPAAAWLFAAKSLDDYATWTRAIRAASPATRVWIQTGSVGAALRVAAACAPDVLVVQGADAGGHGAERSAGVIALLPEARDALEAGGFGGVALVAAGGIADGRGVAAALVLGAQGVVMGTRFLAAAETPVPPGYRRRVLEASDGARSTVRDKIFDQLRGKNIWPVEYDGRALVNDSYVDFKNGMALEEIQKLYAEAEQESEKGFGNGDGKARAAMWAGAGVGLVNKVQPAGEIVKEIRAAAKKALSAGAKLA